MHNYVGTVFDIQHFSISDGPGIRTTVFMKGCNLKCSWCHNPESQLSAPQWLFYKEKCIGCGRCASESQNPNFKCYSGAREFCGKNLTVSEVLSEVMRDKTFYDVSGGGVTFSGGECLLQIGFIEQALKIAKEYGIHTAIDTAGHVPFSSFEKIIPYTDLFLYDVKCFDSEKHKKYVGVGNELILSNLKRLLALGCKVKVRIPIIPTVNDSICELEKIRDFLNGCGRLEGVELLPYHSIGESKYEAIGKKVISFAVPSNETMEKLNAVFK